MLEAVVRFDGPALLLLVLSERAGYLTRHARSVTTSRSAPHVDGHVREWAFPDMRAARVGRRAARVSGSELDAAVDEAGRGREVDVALHEAARAVEVDVDHARAGARDHEVDVV